MHRRVPPLHALAAFEAAARHQSFAKAADELCLSHSAVSHRIRQLEEFLGVKLFLRLNRNILPTPAGEAFLGAVREALGMLQAASAALGEARRTRLVVSVAPALASYWLAHRIAEFQALHPEIELEIQASSHMANLRSADTDVGLRYGIEGEWPGCDCVELIRHELYPVCSPAYLEKIGPVKRPADLAKATLLRTRRITPWKPWFQAAGLDWPEPKTGPLFSEVTILLDAAINSAGVALAGRLATQGALLSGRLVRLLDVACVPPQAYYAVCLPEKRQRPEVARFIDWVHAEAREDLYKGAEVRPRG